MAAESQLYFWRSIPADMPRASGAPQLSSHCAWRLGGDYFSALSSALYPSAYRSHGKKPELSRSFRQDLEQLGGDYIAVPTSVQGGINQSAMREVGEQLCRGGLEYDDTDPYPRLNNATVAALIFFVGMRRTEHQDEFRRLYFSNPNAPAAMYVQNRTSPFRNLYFSESRVFYLYFSNYQTFWRQDQGARNQYARRVQRQQHDIGPPPKDEVIALTHRAVWGRPIWGPHMRMPPF